MKIIHTADIHLGSKMDSRFNREISNERKIELRNTFKRLVEYANGCAWLCSKSEREEYALDLHMSRIFDNQDWVGYLEFNKKHRPHVLQDDGKGVARCECESEISVSAEESCRNRQTADVYPQVSNEDA